MPRCAASRPSTDRGQAPSLGRDRTGGAAVPEISQTSPKLLVLPSGRGQSGARATSRADSLRVELANQASAAMEPITTPIPRRRALFSARSGRTIALTVARGG